MFCTSRQLNATLRFGLIAVMALAALAGARSTVESEPVIAAQPTDPTPSTSPTMTPMTPMTPVTPTTTMTTTPTATMTTTAQVTPTATTTDVLPTATTGPTPTPLAKGPTVALEEVVSGLTAPVDADWSPDGSGRLFVVDQVGRILIVSPQGEVLETPFLDLQDRMVELREGFDERGLLGLAFHPEYADNGRFFVYYSAPLRASAPDDWDHTSHLSEFTVSSDSNVADPASEQVILQVDQPQFNHDAGTIAFSRDGFLYVPLGDGGGANDTGVGHPPQGNGQDTSTLLGSILRLDVDVDGDPPYAIPEDNPFVDDPEVADEIWAYGFRNPYRLSFDALTGELFVGDAGQNLWEEVDRVVRGGNYGWNIREGTHCFDPDSPDDPPETCPEVGSRGEPLLPPIIEYGNSGSDRGGLGIAVVGGYMYRGTALSGLQGRYVFGDWSSGFAETDGRLFVAEPLADGLWPIREIEIEGRPDGLGSYLLAFGQGPDEELYILTSDTTGPTGETGKLLRLVSAETPAPAIFLPIAYQEYVIGR